MKLTRSIFACSITALVLAFGVSTAVAEEPIPPVPAGGACPTINPPGTNCMPDEACIRLGGSCAITDATPPIKCKCVV